VEPPTLGVVSTKPSAATPATDCWPPLPGAARRNATRLAAIALLLDLVAAVAFVAIGRRSHEEDSGLGNLFEIAAPFMIGVAAGWAIMRLWRSPLWSNRAIGMWLITVALGMVLRRTVFDRGTAVSFVIVTTIVLGVFLLGWRGVAEQLRARRRPA
jgi:hypothetical protein